jgi:hypothetical protein
MKTFSDASFLFLFDSMLLEDNPGGVADTWEARGVRWQKHRHGFECEAYGYTLEAFTGTAAGKTGWTLLVVKEHWWAGRRGDVLKTQHWAKPLHGARPKIIAWLNGRKQEIEKRQAASASASQ